MSAKHSSCVIPEGWNENWQDVLRVWVTGAGMPTLRVPDLDPAERWFGIILCDVFLHQANAIADGNPAKAEKIHKKMRDALKKIFNKPCDWDLSPYEDYARLPAQNEQSVPAIVSADKDALEVLRVWLDPQAGGKIHVSLLPLGPDQAAEFCVTLMRLIARDLAHWSSEDESIVFARIKSHFVDQLQTYGLEIVDGKMVGPRDRMSNKLVLAGGIVLGAILMLSILVFGAVMFFLSQGDNLEAQMIQNAWEQKQGGNLAGAIETCNKIIEMNPSYANAYDSRARFNSELHEEEAAIKDFSKAIEYDPKNGEVFQARAYSLTQLGRYKEAKQDCETAIKYGCNTPYVRELLRFCEHPQRKAPGVQQSPVAGAKNK